MPVTQLSDVIVPRPYLDTQPVDNLNRSQFITAGVMVVVDELNAIAAGPGKTIDINFWKDLDWNIEENYSNDDPADLAVPNKITAGTMSARKAFVNGGWSAMDLARELSSQDPMQRIRDRTSVYWEERKDVKVLAIIIGLLAESTANRGGDLITNISSGTGDAAKFQMSGGDAVIDAAASMGEYGGKLKTIMVHPNIRASMLKNKDIDILVDENGLNIETYKGLRLIVSSKVPVTGANADRIYDTLLFGDGAFGFGGQAGGVIGAGNGTPIVPVEVERTPRAGHGGGQETLWERYTWMMHPFGYTWLEGGSAPAMAEYSPRNSDLRLAGHWTRVLERERIPLAVVRSKA